VKCEMGKYAPLTVIFERMAAMKMGPGTEPATQLGPLVNAASRDKVAALVDDAVKRGAVVLTSGLTPQVSGYFYPPTVIADVPEGSRLLGEELFGPVAPMITFDSEQEGICLANRTEFGLVAYVYTKDLARGLRVSEKLESGMVAVNRGLVSDPHEPESTPCNEGGQTMVSFGNRLFGAFDADVAGAEAVRTVWRQLCIAKLRRTRSSQPERGYRPANIGRDVATPRVVKNRFESGRRQ
jgi:hypothetical protein